MAGETTAHALDERLALIGGAAREAPTSAHTLALRRSFPPAAFKTISGPVLQSFQEAWRGLLPALAVERERGTGFLLLPVLFGAGAAANFAFANEPSVLVLFAVTALAAAALLRCRR